MTGKRKFKKTKLTAPLKQEQKLLEINYFEIAKRTIRQIKERIKNHGAS